MDEGPGRDLTGPDCHALVVGTGRHPAGARLVGLPSAARSATALAEALRSACGMADDRGDRVTLITDPAGPSDVLAAVEAVTERAEGGVVLFCFVGHGLLGPAEQLYLATSAGTSAHSTAHAVPYAEIRNLLSASSARPVVILDCCFSGLAEAVQQGPRRDPYVSARPDGSFLLASATHYAAAFAPEGEEHTLFSGELLRLLREGDAGGPKWFTLADLYRQLDRRLQGAPARPHSDSVGRIGDLAVAPNPRYAPAAGPGPEPPRSGGPCPYPGMRPFLPEQHHLFFGREKLTRALLDRVTDDGPAGPVVLVGPSGVGKSSLLRAGLGAALDATGRRPVLLVPAPGTRPFRTLTTSWADATGRPFGEVERDLGAGRFGGPPDGRKLPGVLIVDQFEELFTHCEDAEERELFIRALTGAGASPGPRIVLGLRADYFGHCLRDPRLARLVRNGQFTVPAMADDEVRSAVEGPAAYAGLRLEDGLADHLLRELKDEHAGAGGAIALPFLAHALQETWARRHGDRLTFAGYQATGGIRTSVGTAAERIHDSLDADGRCALKDLLLRMVRLVDGDGRAVRRRVRIDELGPHAELLGRLADARLVVVDDDQAQLCHDSLLSGWPRLRDWINADLGGLLVRRRLGDAADAWAEAGRPPSGLYAGRHLAAARAVTADDGPGFPSLRPVEQDFLAASGRAQRRRKTVQRAGLAIVVVLAVLASTLAVLARGAQHRAEDRESVLLARQLAAKADVLRERDPLAARRLSLAAYRLASTPESRSSLFATQMSRVPVDLKGTDGPVLHMAYSGDGRVLVTSRPGGRVQLWDLSRPTAPRKAAALDLGSRAAVAFHPRSRLLAAQTASGFAVWDTTDPQRPRRLAARGAPGGTVSSLAFSPDGRTVAAGLAGRGKGRLLLWDLADPARPEPRTDRAVAEQDVVSLAFHHEGRLLAVSSGTLGGQDGAGASGAVGLWDVRDAARPVLKDTVTTGTATALAFHPRRGVLVGASRKSDLFGWTVDGGERLKAFAPAKGTFTYWEFEDLPVLGFSGDGTTLAWQGRKTAPYAKSVLTLRRVEDTDPALSRRGTDESNLPVSTAARAVAWDPGGAYVAAGGEDGTVRLWPLRPPAPAAVGALPYVDTGTSPISHDGTLMITEERGKGTEETRRVWDVRRRTAPRLRFTVPEPWEIRNFLPRTSVLLAHRYTAATKDHLFRLWDMSGSGDPVPGGDIPFKAPDVNLGFSPDGRLLALGRTFDRRIELWDVSKPRTPVRRSVFEGSTGDFSSSIWFLTPRVIATREDKGKVQLWDIADPGRPRRAGAVDGMKSGTSIGFSTARNLMLAEEPGRKVALWDLSDLHRPRRGGLIPAGVSGYEEIGGDIVAAVDENNSVQFWDVKDFRHPRKTRTMLLDQEKSTDVKRTPDPGRILMGPQPWRIWDVGPGGDWRTPHFVSLPEAKRVELFPDRLPLIAVTSEKSPDKRPLTFLLDPDTDRLYAELCRTDPSGVPREDWKNLFSDLAYQRSC
ncbi:caspase, EACC1-associated type [Streptomyces sp. URMC 124]|uniref:caspase, EACC1-associated type n=1 Tax=Streptomyces sp. URMC 124 TaxID=3423405 RepID=UPI003F1C14E4